MNSRQLELALKKQRLQIRSAALRADFADAGSGLLPLLAAGDQACDGVRWLRQHPQLIAGAFGVLLVVRPRALPRWVRRSVIAWQAWRRLRGWLATDAAAARS